MVQGEDGAAHPWVSYALKGTAHLLVKVQSG